jgi:tRNA1Val (adenine37-N6)-methyltransferase
VLHQDGRFCVILPLIEGKRFVEIAQNFGFFCTRMTEVLPRVTKNVERLLLEFRLSKQLCETTQLTLRQGSEYTEEYKNLTKDFYTIF